MRTIWKFELAAFTMTPSRILLPKDAKILSVQEQAGRLVLWVEVDPDGQKEERFFAVRLTGSPIHGEVGTYLATVQVATHYVVHVYEVRP